jgi:hypothetical protein
MQTITRAALVGYKTRGNAGASNRRGSFWHLLTVTANPLNSAFNIDGQSYPLVRLG